MKIPRELVHLKFDFEKSVCVSLRSRTVGMHTGSRSAGAAGRIPVFDVAELRMQYWQSLGFHGTGIASFVDNLLAASDDTASAIRIQDDCAKHLGLRWNLHIGEDSREYLVCKNKWSW